MTWNSKQSDLRALAQAVRDAGERLLCAVHCGEDGAQEEAEHDAATAALDAALAHAPGEPTGNVADRILAALDAEREAGLVEERTTPAPLADAPEVPR